MANKKRNKKENKKEKIVIDEKLDKLARKERENYGSRSWNRLTSGGFYNL